MTAKEIQFFLSARNMLTTCINTISKYEQGQSFTTRMLYRAVEREDIGQELTPRQKLLIKFANTFIRTLPKVVPTHFHSFIMKKAFRRKTFEEGWMIIGLWGDEELGEGNRLGPFFTEDDVELCEALIDEMEEKFGLPIEIEKASEFIKTRSKIHGIISNEAGSKRAVGLMVPSK